MDKIYSRKVIKLPKIDSILTKSSEPKKNKNRKIVKVIVIFAIAFNVVFGVNNAVEPVYELLAQNKAKVIATEILNIESSKVLKNVKYEDLVQIDKDNQNNISMIKFDVIEMNLLASDIAYNIQQELNKIQKENISIPLLSLFGIKYLSGFGPKINIKLIPIGNVITDVKSSFEEAGINQTIHRIYLDVTCIVNIVSRV